MRNQVNAVVIAILLVACQGQAAQATPVAVATDIPLTPTPTASAAAVVTSGTVTVDGSDTIYPLVLAVAQVYMQQHPGVTVQVNQSGTGGGFKKFCGMGEAPSIDIGMASRPITKAELDACNLNNITYLKLLIAYDGVTVIVHKTNTFVDCLSVDQIKALIAPAGLLDTPDRWSGLNPAWPDTPIDRWLPDENSGTRGYLADLFFGSSIADPSLAVDLRSNVAGTGTLAQVIDGVAADPDGIGFVSYDLFAANYDRLRQVPIQQADGKCVPPTAITIGDGQYATMHRPLYFYVNKNGIKSNPALSDFVQFSMGPDGFVDAVNHVSLALPDQGIYHANIDLILNLKASP
jgi:phosphate transport system substrate-binding protein